jgi:hypothetical protein
MAEPEKALELAAHRSLERSAEDSSRERVSEAVLQHARIPSSLVEEMIVTPLRERSLEENIRETGGVFRRNVFELPRRVHAAPADGEVQGSSETFGCLFQDKNLNPRRNEAFERARAAMPRQGLGRRNRKLCFGVKRRHGSRLRGGRGP